MQATLPVRLFAPPSHRIFKNDDGSERGAWITTVLDVDGGEAVRLYCDEDPMQALNGSREKLERGQMVDVGAVLRLYPRKGSGLGVALVGFVDLPAAK